MFSKHVIVVRRMRQPPPFFGQPPLFISPLLTFPFQTFFLPVDRRRGHGKKKEQEEGAERGQRGKLTTEEGGGLFLERREE